MLERLLENWLDNASERSYQPVFCQILVSKGYTIVHNTRHTPIEFGKDIIAIAPDGTPCAYQLKGNPGGRLNLTQYRNEVFSQLNEMAFYSLEPMGITQSHHCFLVTNGEVEEDVRRAIDDFNRDIEKKVGAERKIKIIARGEFLADAVSLEGNLWPKEIEDMRLMLEIMSTKGDNLFPFKKFDALLRNTLYLEYDSKKPKQKDIKRAITSAGLLTSACLYTFEKEKNYYAAITAWSMYASYLVAICERYKFDFNKISQDSFAIANEAILTNLLLLLDDVLEKLPRLIEGWVQIEFAVYKYRYTLIVGLMSLLWLWPGIKDLVEGDKLKKLEEFLNDAYQYMSMFGEAAVPQYLLYYWYLRKNNQKEAGKDILGKLLEEICSKKTGQDPQGLVDAYTTIGEVVTHQFSQTLENIDSPLEEYTFLGSSNFSKSIFTLMVTAGLKSKCQELWYNYSNIGFDTFTPEEIWCFCLIHSENGDNNTSFPPETGEWKELEKEAKELSTSSLPEPFVNNPYMLAIFTILFPYRATIDVIKYLDSCL